MRQPHVRQNIVCHFGVKSNNEFVFIDTLFCHKLDVQNLHTIFGVICTLKTTCRKLIKAQIHTI